MARSEKLPEGSAAPAPAMQCRGTTAKGTRCRRSAESGYCHQHAPRAKTRPPPPAGPVVVFSPPRHPCAPHAAGFIYAYTLTDLLTPAQKLWLEVQRAPGAAKYNPLKSNYTFVKVGMTTKLVLLRLVQWEHQCRHSLTCLQPNVQYFKMSFVDRFKLFLIKTFDTYRDNGFYCRRAAAAEAEIHRRLRDRFGRGNVFCRGCAKDAAARIHVEWFYLRKRSLPEVFHVIDAVCQQYNLL